MKIDAADAAEPTATPRWQQLDERFWVGTIGDRCLGTVERGRTFTLLDRDGKTWGDYRTLRDAQLAALADAPSLERRTHPDQAVFIGIAVVMVAAAIFGLACLVVTVLP